MAHSVWYLVAQAAEVRLQAVATAQAVKLLANPPMPVDLGTSAVALMVLHRGDKLLDQPGQRREKRQMRLVVGVAAKAADALASADELHFAARDALRSEAFRAQLRAVGDVSVVREVEVEPALREAIATGTVLLSAFEIDYFQQYPSAA